MQNAPKKDTNLRLFKQDAKVGGSSFLSPDNISFFFNFYPQKRTKGQQFGCHHIFLKDAEVEGSVLLPPTFPEEKVISAHYTRFADMIFSTVNSK